MSTVLIVENVTIIAQDIAETVQSQLDGVTPVVATSLKEALKIVQTREDLLLCVVSGSAPAQRMGDLAASLSDNRIPTLVMTNHKAVSDVFGSGAEVLGKPFSTQMLSEAIGNLNLSDRLTAQRSGRE